MKKLTAILVGALICACLCLAGCGGGQSAPSKEPTSTLGNDNITIESIYVDDSYKNEEHPSLKRVWVFSEIHPEDNTIEASSYSGKMIIGETTYDAVFQSEKDGMWFSSYHYSNTIKEVFKSETLKIAFMFEVSESDLTNEAKLTFQDLGRANCDGIEVLGKDVQHAENDEAIAKAVDPDGYQKAISAREPADADTASSVIAALDGYEYFASYGSLSWRCAFSGSSYSLRSMGLATTGTFEVLNGYLLFTNDDNGAQSWIPWSWKDDGTISLDLSSGLMGDNG